MNCDKYLDLISARLDGELTALEEAALTAHLRECPACRAIAKDMEGLHSALSHLGEVDVPVDLSPTVMNKIKSEKSVARRRVVRRISGLAACLLLCVGVLRVADATHSEHKRQEGAPIADHNLPSVARHIGPQPVALNRLNAYSLPVQTAAVNPFAYLLNSEEALNRFLGRLPETDLSIVTDTYNADFFCSNRLLAVVVQEPSSSITHRVTELTEDRVVILRDIPEAGDCDMAQWLILAEVEGTGPETPLSVELLTN